MRDAMSPDPRRRAMLRALGLAGAGAAVAAPSMAASVDSTKATAPAVGSGWRRDVHVALLLPSSAEGMSPAASAFRDGFALGADSATTRRIVAQVHDVGSGIGRARTFARDQRARRDTDIAVAMMSARASPWLQEDLAAAGVPLLLANAGERVVHGDAISPAYVYSSLELAAAAYASGRWAAEHAGRRCALACSLYESGFDMVPAFRAGFEAGGGTVVLSRVTDTPTDTIDIATAARELADSDADVLAAFFNGDDAREFFAAYRGRETSSRRVVIASPLVTADEASGVALTSVTSWSPAMAGDANRSFVAAFTTRFGHAPDAFAMLGYETARMIGHASPGDQHALAHGLRRTHVGDVRGALTLDPRSNEIRAPLFVREVGADGTESLVPIALPATSGHLVRALPHQRGWISSYLTV
jgi:branched-chain amino acid transport system substrate-binding protein